MEQTVQELRTILADYTTKFQRINHADFSAKLNDKKWSKQEVLGHLIDSAQNNLRRFICGQYETTPPTIVYDQEFWVKANHYQHTNKEDVILLWKLTNERIADILSNMPAANHVKTCNNNKETPTLHTLAWLAQDYVKHIKHHINQIIPNSFNVTYP